MMIDDARHKAFVRQYEKDALAEMNRYDQYSVERRLDAERISRLESARLARMPQKSAQVYELCFHEERSAREIAELMQMNQRTVEGHIYRCRKEMREYLRKVM
jgi:RNA polymerase sigma factor (sigma-70 family)